MALMPRCVARLLSEARAELITAGYSVTVIAADGDATSPGAVVIAQTPARDAVVTSPNVTLEVLTPPPDQFVIPDLLGLPMGAAEGFHATLPLGSGTPSVPVPLLRDPATAADDALVTHWNTESDGANEGEPSDPPKSGPPARGATVPRGVRLLIINRPGTLPPLPPPSDSADLRKAFGLGFVSGAALGILGGRLLLP